MTTRTEEFRSRVRTSLVDRARRDPREDVLEQVAEIYRQEAAIYARAFDYLSRESLEEIIDDALLEARDVQTDEPRFVRASDLIDFESSDS